MVIHKIDGPKIGGHRLVYVWRLVVILHQTLGYLMKVHNHAHYVSLSGTLEWKKM
jgi:hypothetical protein